MIQVLFNNLVQTPSYLEPQLNLYLDALEAIPVAKELLDFARADDVRIVMTPTRAFGSGIYCHHSWDKDRVGGTLMVSSGASILSVVGLLAGYRQQKILGDLANITREPKTYMTLGHVMRADQRAWMTLAFFQSSKAFIQAQGIENPGVLASPDLRQDFEIGPGEFDDPVAEVKMARKGFDSYMADLRHRDHRMDNVMGMVVRRMHFGHEFKSITALVAGVALGTSLSPVFGGVACAYGVYKARRSARSIRDIEQPFNERLVRDIVAQLAEMPDGRNYWNDMPLSNDALPLDTSYVAELDQQVFPMIKRSVRSRLMGRAYNFLTNS